MGDLAAMMGEEATPPPLRARRALLKRLADVVSLPASRINAFERAVTGDLLVEMLRLASHDERKRVAARLAPLAELPNSVARILLRDDPDIAGLLIEQCASLSDADIVGCARDASFEHRMLLAVRRARTPAGHAEQVREQIAQLKAFYGLRTQCLEALIAARS